MFHLDMEKIIFYTQLCTKNTRLIQYTIDTGVGLCVY